MPSMRAANPRRALTQLFYLAAQLLACSMKLPDCVFRRVFCCGCPAFVVDTTHFTARAVSDVAVQTLIPGRAAAGRESFVEIGIPEEKSGQSVKNGDLASGANAPSLLVCRVARLGLLGAPRLKKKEPLSRPERYSASQRRHRHRVTCLAFPPAPFSSLAGGPQSTASV